MLTPTHLMVIVLAGMLLRLSRDEWFMAMLFGVVIDVDHLFALPRYVADNGWPAILRQTWDDGSGLPWRSWLHHPMSALVVGYLSPGWRLALPLAAWAIHLGMDGLQLVLGDMNTVAESAILISSTAGIVAIGYSRWTVMTGMSGLRAYADFVARSSRAALSGIRGVT
jgi:hypothetical protein